MARAEYKEKDEEGCEKEGIEERERERELVFALE